MSWPPRIAEMLRAGTPLWTGRGGERVPATFDQGRPSVRGPLVQADDVSLWYWQSDRDVWDLRDDFGPMRPPFDEMWIEWRNPLTAVVGGKIETLTGKSHQGAQLQVVEVSDPPPGADLTVIIHPVSGVKNAVLFVPVTILLHLAKDGTFIQHQYLTQEAGGLDSPWVIACEDMLKIVALTVSFMHCKNVTLQDSVIPPKRQRVKAQKSGQPSFLSYKTIKLPRPAQESRSLTGARTAAGPGVALHLVRGHFKTFTVDKPLMGRHTGTYWWASHARGDVRLGAVAHDYSVSPS